MEEIGSERAVLCRGKKYYSDRSGMVEGLLCANATRF
jgi:hypothetical protein